MTANPAIADGFPGERLRVLPRPLVKEALLRPVTRRLLVTDVGFFPRAAHHGRQRPNGTGEAIIIACASGRGWCDLGGTRFNI
ncbi:MAG: hypothetical protein LBK28_07200, partial [Propionibacteriaceae bacterium]|nr:hypothetical protein [Propionibacteriaceae bacterium]